MGQSWYYYNLTWYVTDTQTFCAWNTLSVSKQACLKVKEFNFSFCGTKKKNPLQFYFLPSSPFCFPVVCRTRAHRHTGRRSAGSRSWVKTLELSVENSVVLSVHPVNSVTLLSGGTERCQRAFKQLADVRQPGSVFSLSSPSWQDFTFLCFKVSMCWPCGLFCQPPRS